MILHAYYVYPLVHAGEVPVGVLVGIILPITVIAAVSVSLVAILAVSALRQKAKEHGTVDIEPTVSVDKCGYYPVFLSCMALV